MPISEVSRRLLDAFDSWEVPAEMPRPRLFVPAGGLAELRELPDSDSPEWERLRKAAEAAIERGSTMPGSADILTACGLAYLVSGEERYAAPLVATAERTLAIDNWIPASHSGSGLTVDLHVAHNTRELAWVYDWLYDHLSPQQRAELLDGILRRGLGPFLSVHRSGKEWWSRGTDNWRAVICGEMGLAAMAVAFEWPHARASLRESLEGVLATLDVNPTDGSYTEGLGYWSYGIGYTAWFAECLRNFTRGAVDLYQYPFMQRTADFALYLTTPDFKSMKFGDDRGLPPSAELLSLLAARTKDGHAQWLSQRIRPFVPLSLLWRRDSPAPSPPLELPLVKSFPPSGATVMRSDWSDEAIYVGLKTGETTADHSHLDINSLILLAFGERLLDDTGRWHYDHGGGFFECESRRWDYVANATAAHSTLVVDSEGQRWGEEYRGEIVHLQTTPESSYAVAAGADAYGPVLMRFVRHVLLAAEGYVIVIDDVETEDPSRLEWRWQTRGEVDLAELAQDRWQITQGAAALDSDLLWPDGAEGRSVTRSEVVAHYRPALDRRPETHQETLSYVAIAPLHRQKSAVMVTVFHPRPLAMPPAPKARLLSRSHTRVEVAVPGPDGGATWTVSLQERLATRR